MKKDVLLVGLGLMGKGYAAVLASRGVSTLGVGRSRAGADAFTAACGMPALDGGLARLSAQADAVPDKAIVCVNLEETPAVVSSLLAMGVHRILVEKPGAATVPELQELAQQIDRSAARVYVAYNRRFYASVIEARKRIADEGGVTSFHFEFTEREKDGNSPKFSAATQNNWALANSTHVIDLAFHLGGRPTRLSSEVSGSLPWHPAGAHFAGSGRTDSGALFSYCANWASGGRWGIELMTQAGRLILKPLESLAIQRRGTFEVAAVELDDDLDKRFKPGLYRQTAAFLDGEGEEHLITLSEQATRAATTFASITGEGRE